MIDDNLIVTKLFNKNERQLNFTIEVELKKYFKK